MKRYSKTIPILIAVAMKLDSQGYKDDADQLDKIANKLNYRLALETKAEAPRQHKIKESPHQTIKRLYDRRLHEESIRMSQAEKYDTCLHCSSYLFVGDKAYRLEDGTALHLKCVPEYVSMRATFAQTQAIELKKAGVGGISVPGANGLTEDEIKSILPGEVTILQ